MKKEEEEVVSKNNECHFEVLDAGRNVNYIP